MPYKDEKGHFTNKENDGGPCHHEGGKSFTNSKEKGKGNKQKFKEWKENIAKYQREDQYAEGDISSSPYLDDSQKQELLDLYRDKVKSFEKPKEAFDDDYEEEFKYVPQTKIEKAVDEYIKKNWDNIDKNKTVGELAYKVSAMIGKPYPQVLDAVGKSIAARNEAEFDDGYTGREPGGIKGDLEKAGFDDVKVVDDKTLSFTGPNAQAGWTIKENENLGFDVYDETGKKVIDDFNANRGNIATAMLQREQNPMKDFDVSEFDNEDEFEDKSNDESVEYKDFMLKARTAETDGDKEWLENQAQTAYEDGKISQGQLDDVILALRERENSHKKNVQYDKEAAEKFKNAGFDVASEEEVNEVFGKKPQESLIEKYNRMVGLESQMHSKIDNAKKNGQSPQQVLDSVAYDMNLQPGTEEYDRLKNLVMYDTRLNKDTGSYEYNKYNIGSNKQVSGDERKKLQDLSDAFNKAGLENKLEDTWEDYGARMGMTNLIHNNVQVLNPKDWMDYMNGNASAEEIIDRVKNSPYKSAYKWKPNRSDEDKAAYKKYWNAKGKSDSDINLDKWSEIIEDSKPHYEDFDENEEVDYNGNKSKIIRRLSSDEKWDRSYANNPFAGDYYEVEYDLLGKPTRNIAWAGRLHRKGK